PAVLADQVPGAVAPGARGVDRAARQHEPVAGAEPMVLATGSERDLAGDHPQALVVVVRVRLIVGARVVAPHERLESLGLEPLEEPALGRRPRLVPRDPFELHQPGFGPTITT